MGVDVRRVYSCVGVSGGGVACVETVVIIIIIKQGYYLQWFRDISGCCHGDRFQLTDRYHLILVKLCIQTTPTVCTSHAH